jgi:L-serine dehydratase
MAVSVFDLFKIGIGPGSRHTVAFNEMDDLKFFRRETLPLHANGLRFTAFDAAGDVLAQRVYYSVGGGFPV